MSTISTALAEALVFQLLLIFIIARRAFMMLQGTRYSENRVLVLSGLYVFVFLLSLLETYGVVSWYYTVGSLVLIPLAALLFMDHASRTVVFTPSGSGGWTYKLPLTLVLVYIGAWGVRLGLEAIFYPSILTGAALPTGGISSSADLALGVVTLLFGFSTGLILGRNLGVIRAYKRLPAGPSPQVSSAPLPSQGQVPVETKP